MPVPAIILAAGASRRLGQPKQLVRVAGETLLARTIRVVCESGTQPVIVVLGAHRESIVSEVDLSGVQVVTNHNWEQGIASSIHEGMRTVEQSSAKAAAVLLLVCDQPKLSVEHLRRLIEVYQEADEPAIVASRYAGIAGIPAIFPMNQFEKLLRLRGDAGARYILREPDCAMVTIDFEGGEVDIDTPEDLVENSRI
ncbi:nucleotidyltransferase family protein [Acidicapsa acidisoli]|uniref:nucleotidyltransferase family protein n=1 Tax=Acidicapsa acidisoli TaxID=1615681 RepID=UPI0021DF8E2F|nr:nucleotidyltransferase family protein [Acidicapsa acidisoli]